MPARGGGGRGGTSCETLSKRGREQRQRRPCGSRPRRQRDAARHGDDDPLPIDVARLAPGTFVGDVVMRGGATRLVSTARQRGCRVQPGTDMLFEQIPLYLAFFGFPSATPDELRRLAEVRKLDFDR
jgi:hypothetical protein